MIGLHLGLTLGGRGGGGSPAPTASWMLSASRGSEPTATGGTGANSLRHTSRSRHVMGQGDYSGKQFAYRNSYVDTTGYRRPPGFSTVLKVGIYIPGAPTPAVNLAWSGSTTTTLSDGAGITWSDTLLPSQFGLSSFAAGTVFWITAVRVNVSGDTRVFAGFTGTGAPTGEGAVTDPNATGDQSLATAALTVPSGGAANSSLFLPVAIKGLSATHGKTFLGIGDSILYGQGETTLGAGDGATAGGMFQRGLYPISKPWVMLARPATSIYGYNRLASSNAELYALATDALVEYGRNDIDGTNVTDAVFSATIAVFVMTVTSVAGGTIVAGDKVAGPGVSGTPLIQAFGTGGTTGTGGVGTYMLSVTQTVATTTLLAAQKNAGLSAASAWAEMQTLYAALKAGGTTRVRQTTISPKTTSTDSWVTTTNQTVASPNRYQAGDALFDLNALIITGAANLDGTVLVAEALRDAAEPGKWGVSAGPVARTVDGLHPNPTGHALGGGVIQTWAS